jgi:cytochrome c oxidase subunit IV
LKIKLKEILPEEEIEEPRIYLHSYPDFSFLLSAISCLVSMFLLPHFKRSSWCLMVLAMEGNKGAVPPS